MGTTEVTRDITYATSARSAPGRALIRVLENATGRLSLIRRAEGYERDVATGRSFWDVIVERYGLSLDVVGGDLSHIPANGPLILVSAPNFPAGTAAEAVARLRAGPQDNMPYASSGVGSMPHFAAAAVAVSLLLGGKLSHVPYRSGGLMVESIARGETAWGVAVLASAAAQVRDNRVRGIAITGLERFPAFPDIPTLAESGMPGFDIGNWFAVVGPPRMPEGTVTALNRAINAALADAQLRESFLIAGISPWTRPNSPADTRAFFQAELLKFKGVVERTGVKMEQ